MGILANVSPTSPFDDVFNGPLKEGKIVAISIFVGTYYGKANGTLEMRLCDGERCASGRADLAHAIDDAFLELRLTEPLAVSTGSRLTFQARQIDGTFPVAVMSFGKAKPGDPLFPFTQSGAAVRFEYESDALPRKVYTGPTMNIYELPHPSPYFEILDGPCQQVVRSRDDVELSCEKSARLLRREMYFPGWTAALDDAAAPIGVYDKLFQTVAVPAGAHRLRFAYAPPFIAFGFAALMLGALAMAGAACWPLRKRSTGHSYATAV